MRRKIVFVHINWSVLYYFSPSPQALLAHYLLSLSSLFISILTTYLKMKKTRTHTRNKTMHFVISKCVHRTIIYKLTWIISLTDNCFWLFSRFCFFLVVVAVVVMRTFHFIPIYFKTIQLLEPQRQQHRTISIHYIVYD